MQADRQSGLAKSDPTKEAAHLLRDEAGADFTARLTLAATTSASFRERWALFWANHFTVSATKLATAALVGPFETEAIRPRIFGRFEDLLVASSQHPAMLTYLDQATSIGPDSPAARLSAMAGKERGLNENLAREILELHTVGVEAGYDQTDVTEFARALTGWSIGSDREPETTQGKFFFRARAHEPGARAVMGRRYADGGEEQALLVLKDLAASPHTARHVATKLARHFVADDPPPSLTARLQRTFAASDGDLAQVARALATSPEAWAADARKFKTPYEFLISSWRLAGVEDFELGPTAATLAAMGQKPFSAPSPKGWPDDAATWCSPDAVVKRLAWSEGFAAKAAGQSDPLMLARSALGGRLSSDAEKSIARAETRSEAVAILLMAPEFQRR